MSISPTSPNRVTAMRIRGIDGIGKTALAAGSLPRIVLSDRAPKAGAPSAGRTRKQTLRPETKEPR